MLRNEGTFLCRVDTASGYDRMAGGACGDAGRRLEGVPASPKGLRHGFGVAAVTAGIPLNLVQKWLGHAQLSTTAVYADAVGAEEKDIARRMWG
jgi:integrase